MKKIYIYILSLVVTLSYFSTYAQVLEGQTGEFLLIKGGYLTGIGDKACCNEETPDLTFRFTTGSGLSNHDIIELAREAALNAWFDRQRNLMKNEIENRFNKTYSNFDQARNDYFKNWEKKNLLSHTDFVKDKYDNRINVRKGKRDKSVRNLKLLELREIELNIGNIDNTSYGSFNFNGTPIGDIRTLSQLNTLRNREMGIFSTNEIILHRNQGISQFLSIDILNDMGSYANRFNFDYDILNVLLPLQINHYNTIGNGLPYHPSWYQLDLMQMYLNNIRNFGPVITPEVFPRDFGTAAFLESYAIEHRRGGISVWDNGYYNYLVAQMTQNETDERAIEAAEYAAELAVEADRQAALNSLLGDVDIIDLKIQRIIETLGYTNYSAEANWLNSHASEANNLFNYLETNNRSQNAIDFANEFMEITNELPNARFDRFSELNQIIENNPWALINDCAQQNGLDIANYQLLYNHTLPTVCTNRLNILGNDFQDQPLNTGNAAVANVDYYGVEITTNPDINRDGNPDTIAEVYRAYRANFGNLASGGKDNFQFSCNIPFNSDNTANVSWTFTPYYANDITMWNSSNPLTTIFKIDANADISLLGNLISDDGAIMISAFTPEYWIGSTITTEFSGTQPFSGNRQWGYITNQSGNLELYARAVDVARVSNLVRYYTLGSNECKTDTYYNIGEATWSNLQEQIKQWIIDNGGQATIVPKTAVRFDKSKLKEMLESNETIDQIPCN
jgi:hypothetical protein